MFPSKKISIGGSSVSIFFLYFKYLAYNNKIIEQGIEQNKESINL